MFSSKVIFTALLFHGMSTVSLASADPVSFPNMTACSGSTNPTEGCVTIPIVSDDCTNFVGGLSFLNKEVSCVQVPSEYVCTYFQDFGCLGKDGIAVLTAGTWNMFDVPKDAETTQNFNDLTSSVSCTPFEGAIEYLFARKI